LIGASVPARGTEKLIDDAASQGVATSRNDVISLYTEQTLATLIFVKIAELNTEEKTQSSLRRTCERRAHFHIAYSRKTSK